MATRLLRIERTRFCSVHFMLCPQGVALQKSPVSGMGENWRRCCGDLCPVRDIVVVAMHARTELQKRADFLKYTLYFFLSYFPIFLQFSMFGE